MLRCKAVVQNPQEEHDARMHMHRLLRIFAWVVSALGLFCILCSHLGYTSYLQLPPATWPMPYLSACALLLSGVALRSLESRALLSKILGVAIFALGCEGLIERFLIVTPLGYSGMAVSGALGFIAIGIVLFFWTARYKPIIKSLILLFCSVFLVSIGGVEVCLGAIPIPKESELTRLVPHFYTSLAFLCLGTAFLYLHFSDRWPEDKKRIHFFKKD